MFVIVTGKSLLWQLATLTATLLMLIALVSPTWLVTSTPRAASVRHNETILYTPSEGVYTRCHKPAREIYTSCSLIGVRGLWTDSSVFPTVWKVATVLIMIGLVIMFLTVLTGIVSLCFQSVNRKSIFTISGTTQVVAGMFFILGVILQPMGWGSSRVQALCGRDAAPFNPENCNIGLGLYLAILGTLLTFASASISVLADRATSSDRIQDKIDDGHTFICLP